MKKYLLLCSLFSVFAVNVSAEEEIKSNDGVNKIFVCTDKMSDISECLSEFESSEIDALLNAPTVAGGFNALVRCESWNFQPELCNIGEPLSNVSLISQHSVEYWYRNTGQ